MRAHPPTPSHLRHLAVRALSSLRARPLGPREESEVAGLLDDDLAAISALDDGTRVIDPGWAPDWDEG